MGDRREKSGHEFERPRSIPRPPVEAWAISPEAALEALDVTSARGLSDSEALRRRGHWGANQLREPARISQWRILWNQLASPIVLLLFVATLVAIAFEERLEAIAIGVVLVVNSLIGYLTERRALRAVEALRVLGSIHATVRRSGATRIVAAQDLVPGDIVVLDAGDILTADLRLTEASRLQADESTLTGESLAIDKSTEPVANDAALPDRTSMLFKGTAVTRGSAEGVVVATGMSTELGQISRLVDEAEPESTPLEVRLDRLGRRLIALTLGIACMVAAASLWTGRELYVSIEIALALAVAAVPEGLPIVATVALARGMWRMARRNALVEQLSAVETLGSTSILLMDKTGTLTENRMVVGEFVLPHQSTIRFDPNAEVGAMFMRDGIAVDPDTDPLLQDALRTAALCNNAKLPAKDAKDQDAVGDPTEVALLHWARAAGVSQAVLLKTLPEIREIAFGSESKKMATLHRDARDGGSVFAAIKGAPEMVVAGCTHRAAADGERIALDSDAQQQWLDRASEMATSGHRVLALASRSIADMDEFAYEDMTLLGLVGLLDPPRASVPSALSACRAAGIRPVMITGDHGGTAWHIARATGLVAAQEDDPTTFIDARSLPDFDALSPIETERLLEASVIARATPKQKLDLISLFQRHRGVVAMTGDGVNDAPALKKADIGIAMGMRGTQVAREAADMILRDDELGTIVVAVAQGRAIFSNIRKFVLYLLSCNLSEILSVVVALLAQIPLPLLPLQILFLNLVTDVFPALALGVGEGAPTLMSAPPRQADDPIIDRHHWVQIFVSGSIMAGAVLASLVLATEVQAKSSQQANTVAFLTLALAQLWHVFNMREIESAWIQNEITRNRWIWGALALCVALIALAVFWAPLAHTLSVANPGGDGIALAVSMSLIPFVAGQIQIGIRTRTRRGAASQARSKPGFPRVSTPDA